MCPLHNHAFRLADGHCATGHGPSRPTTWLCRTASSCFDSDHRSAQRASSKVAVTTIA
ncbi:MAG: hypothetical protein M3302_06160 [Actinomycetota bacterium]|nr:hypothetical protein [Actinomycetota bacterium]